MPEDDRKKGLLKRLWEWFFGSPGDSGQADERKVDEARLKLATVSQEMLSLYVDWANTVDALEKAQAKREKQPVLLSLTSRAEMAKMAYDSKLRQHQNMATEVKAAMAAALLASEVQGTGVEPDPERLEQRYRAAYERTQQLKKVESQMQRGDAVLNDLHSEAMSMGQPESSPRQEIPPEEPPASEEPSEETQHDRKDAEGREERPMPE